MFTLRSELWPQSGPATAAAFAPSPLGQQRRLAAGYEVSWQTYPFIIARQKHPQHLNKQHRLPLYIPPASNPFTSWTIPQDGVIRIWQPAAPKIVAESGHKAP